MLTLWSGARSAIITPARAGAGAHRCSKLLHALNGNALAEPLRHAGRLPVCCLERFAGGVGIRLCNNTVSGVTRERCPQAGLPWLNE